MKKFENMTIADLRKLTESYKKMEKENFFLKRKYPNKVFKEEAEPKTAEQMVGELI